MAILCGMVSAALVAGNTVIMKPSEQSVIIGAMLMEIYEEAGVPPGVLNFLNGKGSVIGAHMVDHKDIDLIAFTGSREVGLMIWESAGKTRDGQRELKRVICEMGGKNAMIVDSDADLDEAIVDSIYSAFGFQGQKCSALSRLIAREEIFGPVLSVLKVRDLDEAIEVANGTDYALTGGFFSRSPANIERIKAQLEAGNVYINRPCTGAIVGRHPFGGFKMSGSGTKAGGEDYLLNFLVPRVVTENTTRHGFAPEETPEYRDEFLPPQQ